MEKVQAKLREQSDGLPTGNCEPQLIESGGNRYLVSGQPASPATIHAAIRKLSAAFPRHNSEFWELLTETMVRHRISDDDAKRAVFGSIDTLTGYYPTIAEIIEICPRKRAYSQFEALSKTQELGLRMDEVFDRVEISGRFWWVEKGG